EPLAPKNNKLGRPERMKITRRDRPRDSARPDRPARSRGRCPDDPDVAGPSVARYHHAVPPDHPAASGDEPQPVRPSALQGHAPAHVGVTPCHRTPPTAHQGQTCACPAPPSGQAPISSASTARHTVVTIPCRPPISR